MGVVLHVENTVGFRTVGELSRFVTKPCHHVLRVSCRGVWGIVFGMQIRRMRQLHFRFVSFSAFELDFRAVRAAFGAPSAFHSEEFEELSAVATICTAGSSSTTLLSIA